MTGTSPTVDRGAWPGTTAVTTLCWGGARLRGRIVRRDGATATVGVTPTPGTPPLPAAGGAMVLQWSDDSGLHERRVAVEGIRGGLVHVIAVGPPSRTQRRRFYRASITVDVELRDGGRTIPGVTLDLSEGGARATISGEALPLGTGVIAHIRLDDGSWDVPGRVVRQESRGRNAEVGVAFDEVPAPAADAIRRQVFSAQLDARRNGR